MLKYHYFFYYFMELTSLDLYFLLKELQIIKNAKIDKVFNDNKEILFQLHLPGKGKHFLKIILPSTIFLTKYKGDFESGNFGINIRKHLKNTRIRKIEQIDFERIIKLSLDELDLYFELFSPGNVVLCKNNKIVMAKTYKGFGSRVVRPNGEYEFPKKEYNFLDLSEKNLVDLFSKSEKSSVVITLATELGLGGKYSEYILSKSKIDKEKTSLNIKEIKRIQKTIDEIKETLPKAYYGKKLSPIEIEKSKKTHDSFNQALDELLTEKSHNDKQEIVVSKVEKKKEKINKIIREQKARIKGLKISIKENQKKAEVLYENYQMLEKLLDEFNLIKKNHSMKSIKEKLKNHKIIKSIDEKSKKIVVEI